MNPSPEPVTQRDLDRLVDGELTAPEYWQVLTRVEQSPDGWRQCALAFLEAQALREELPWATRMGSGTPVEAVFKTADRRVLRRRVIQISALAACVLVAFVVSGIGIVTRGTWRKSAQPTPAPTIIATNPVPQPAAPKPIGPGPQFVYINQWDGQTGSEMPIPVDLTKTFDPNEPWNPDWGLSAYELQRLQDEGHRLETQNHLIQVSLESGERVVVPMQEVILRRPPEMPFH